MANDAVLASAIGNLRSTSESTLNVTEENRQELIQINRNFEQFFDQMRADRLTGKDKPDTAISSPSFADNIDSLKSDMKGLLSLPTLAGLVASFMASNFGLVGMKDLKANLKGFMNVGKITSLVSDRIGNIIKSIRNSITQKLGLTDANGRRIPWSGSMQDPETKKFMKSELTKFQTKIMRIGWAVSNFLRPLTTFFSSAGKSIGGFATQIGEVISKNASKIGTFIKESRIGKIVGGFLNSALLRVVAWAMAVYDGIKEAIFGIEKADEKEEGYFATFIRAGLGFAGGASASFIGGILDLIVGAIGLIVKGIGKLFFADSWNEDGTYNEDTFLGNFMKRLDEFSFTELILTGIRGITDLLASWIDDQITGVLDWFNTDDDENPTIIAQRERIAQREELSRLAAEKQAAREAGASGNQNVDASTNDSSTKINSQTTVDAGNAENPAAKRESAKKGAG